MVLAGRAVPTHREHGMKFLPAAFTVRTPYLAHDEQHQAFLPVASSRWGISCCSSVHCQSRSACWLACVQINGTNEGTKKKKD
ncbi:hypothetical protein AVEN_179574-1 [Araneus ventricosus]|uniref:Uncharacterized protein n=1 Tax=Araneus ventricosus TaxID=182803 RepID=A0A4Y2BCM1_ARAVE|nr:hypothetical protein AVEN_179574-1 [Araneus ventricosus]